MRRLKAALDPGGVLNPGAVIAETPSRAAELRETP